MNRLLCTLLIAALLLGLCGCAVSPAGGGDRLRVVCSLFPPYDFVRQIAGEDVSLSLLLAPGQECHTYEPTPKDIVDIQSCDLFIYTGGESESWVADILASVGGGVHTLALMDCVETVEEKLPQDAQTEEHNHGKQAVAYDEHVWTAPQNAMRIADAIADELCALDTVHADDYRAAAAAYRQQLAALDDAFSAAVENGARRTLIFADRFPFRYFADAYGLTCAAAFPGCESHAEPSAATVAALIDRVTTEHIPVVLTIEFSNQKLADTLCEATGAAKREFHSCHNVTAAEMTAGETYLSLMTKNLAVLKEALA